MRVPEIALERAAWAVMRRRSDTRPLTEQELSVVRRIAPGRDGLDAPATQAYDRAVVDLLDRCHWEASARFELTDEMRMTIAGRAGLLASGFPRTPFRSIRTIVVHPSTIQLGGRRAGPIPGTVVDGPSPVLGHTAMHGPVFISWDAVVGGTRHPTRGHDVVLHEFAHQLDFADGLGDGTPPLEDDERERWIRVCQAALDELREGEGSRVLRDYAATNPSEFFAVATEVFLTRPGDLWIEHADLYEVLSDFYRQDPARVRTTGTG